MSTKPEGVATNRRTPRYPCSTIWRLIVADGVTVKQVTGNPQLVIATPPYGEEIEATIGPEPNVHLVQIAINTGSPTAAPSWCLRLAPDVTAYQASDDKQMFYIKAADTGTQSIVAMADPPNRTAFLLSKNPPDPDAVADLSEKQDLAKWPRPQERGTLLPDE
jgi:hypothetical protein